MKLDRRKYVVHYIQQNAAIEQEAVSVLQRIQLFERTVKETIDKNYIKGTDIIKTNKVTKETYKRSETCPMRTGQPGCYTLDTAETGGTSAVPC